MLIPFKTLKIYNFETFNEMLKLGNEPFLDYNSNLVPMCTFEESQFCKTKESTAKQIQIQNLR